MVFTHTSYDLVIVGSGSTAFAAALHAAELGKTVVMTEQIEACQSGWKCPLSSPSATGQGEKCEGARVAVAAPCLQVIFPSPCSLSSNA